MGQLSEILIGYDIPVKVGQVIPVFDTTALPFVDGHFWLAHSRICAWEVYSLVCVCSCCRLHLSGLISRAGWGHLAYISTWFGMLELNHEVSFHLFHVTVLSRLLQLATGRCRLGRPGTYLQMQFFPDWFLGRCGGPIRLRQRRTWRPHPSIPSIAHEGWLVGDDAEARAPPGGHSSPYVELPPSVGGDVSSPGDRCCCGLLISREG